MPTPVLSTTGLFTPPHTITNAELVESYNAYATAENSANADAIVAGSTEPLAMSSTEFIEKASGIKSRYVMDKAGVIDPAIMTPQLPERSNDELSISAEIAIAAATQALERAGRQGHEIDAVLCACSNLQRAYPAVSIEVQQALGAGGFAFDMNVACSSATFGIQTAADFIRAGHARSVLVVSPEITSGHLNWRDRDSHFIFGDVATAVLVEDVDRAPAGHWEILGTRLKTEFSNNIRNNFGFLNRTEPEAADSPDKLFVQEGRKVFKEVVPMVSALIADELDRLGLAAERLDRMWLHQANANMNRLIAAKVLGHEASDAESPTVLDRFANTSSAGSIIAFHKHSDDLGAGATGLICSFGAGYSAGCVTVRRAA